MTMDRDFLGAGWAFPVALDEGGNLLTVSREDDVRESILLILETNHGERAMRPEFGANLRTLVFEPLSMTTIALVKHQVQESLILWEPRVDSIRVTVEAVPRSARLDVEIVYRIRSTNTFYNLVYPFYLQEGRT